MQDLLDFYSKTIKGYSKKCERLKQKLRLLSLARLVAFIGVFLLPYVFWNTTFGLISTAICVIGFLYLVRLYEDVKKLYRFNYHLVQINKKELKALHQELEGFNDGKEYLQTKHHFSNDLDLFGTSSFFQYVNRCILKGGKDAFSQLLLSNNIDTIELKQQAIQELSEKIKWRQELTANAMFVKEHTSISSIVKWLHSYQNFTPKAIRYLSWAFLSVFMLVILLSFKNIGLLNLAIPLLILGLAITGMYFGRIKKLAAKADIAKSTFKEYAKLLEVIEDEQFESDFLRQQQDLLKNENKKASKAIAKFSRLLDVMDYNNNVFYAIFGNGCFLGALRTAYLIENWIKSNKDEVERWFEIVAFFEAYSSFGNFRFNHSAFTFPEISRTGPILEVKDLGHPLIPDDKNVKNDFSIADKSFHIITGSNMAGKSTFLRSVGLAIVMANVGLPICAKSCKYSPLKLITSMRSADSLHKGDSYFLAELKRLKIVVDLVQEEPYFVLLDEILRGTNSNDKAKGSKQILARLLKEGATGLIATHDLSLCDAADDHTNVQNYHLDATIENDELSFDYKLKNGVSKTMNASFMLKKMDLI
ncbi:MutS-related protein [Croceivirga thetidis]|uniref:DNA mismatch repair protein MutS n=1 Tax=Croceivirga thetidis TaxID=2721623 RepID=A0ABX1GMB5_9FLAO|nr:DNA mismatch repair protein MutS [Croceivirga thetidis]NKI30709.1 DNA mismatch repair protein MutS [Croceivirga thetidis]